MANYFSYPDGIEKSIEWKISMKNVIYYVSECSKTGGILPEGIQLYRDCKSLESENKRLSRNAYEEVKMILGLEVKVVDIIIHMNKMTSASDEERDFCKDKREGTEGICFNLAGARNNEKAFAIELPNLYALVNKTDDDNSGCICFYGDKPKLENCTHVAMHICGNGTLEAREKFVFLTPIPDEWHINKK
ncbi:MAG: hypothetical protein K1W00_09950 [Lachnospiraceae bacterium]